MRFILVVTVAMILMAVVMISTAMAMIIIAMAIILVTIILITTTTNECDAELVRHITRQHHVGSHRFQKLQFECLQIILFQQTLVFGSFARQTIICRRQSIACFYQTTRVLRWALVCLFSSRARHYGHESARSGNQLVYFDCRQPTCLFHKHSAS